MANKKKLVVTPLTRTIWWATVNESKGMIIGDNKIDVTDNAIESVLDHFILDSTFKEKGFSGYTYKKKDGNEVSICGFDERHVVIKSELWEETKTKAEELDRREKGARAISDGGTSALCSSCNVLTRAVASSYCDNCGVRLIWGEV
jgi:hypothetical protein